MGNIYRFFNVIFYVALTAKLEPDTRGYPWYRGTGTRYGPGKPNQVPYPYPQNPWPDHRRYSRTCAYPYRSFRTTISKRSPTSSLVARCRLVQRLPWAYFITSGRMHTMHPSRIFSSATGLPVSTPTFLDCLIVVWKTLALHLLIGDLIWNTSFTCCFISLHAS